MNEPSRHRRWFRFSLRTLLVVITIVCCWLAWESAVVRHRKAVRQELQGNPAFYFTTEAMWLASHPPHGPAADAAADRPSGSYFRLRTWLGDEPIHDIEYVPRETGFSEARLSELKRVFPEAKFVESEPLYPPCHPGCFPRGTLVETPAGPRPIESIAAGDAVVIIRKSGETATARVQSIFVTDNRLWKIETELGVLFATETQPLCAASGEIRPAGELQPGDSILAFDGREIRAVEVVSASPTDRIEKVINLVLGNSEVFVAGGYLARSKPPHTDAAKTTGGNEGLPASGWAVQSY